MKFELIEGKSIAFQKAIGLIDRFADAPWPVLLLGESGVGKELLARRVHTRSHFSAGPFVPVNCAALPGGLFESELFGYERGAFSGATVASRGLVRSAHGGTLFLDEIGELDLSLQSKLLRLLESGEIRSVGSQKVEQVFVRVIAATNQNLHELVEQGRFRRDLLERLDVLVVTVPPLRERTEDIPEIAAGILTKLGSHDEEADFSPLQGFDWPGNVRQLRNVLIRAHVLGRGRIRNEILARQVEEEVERHLQARKEESLFQGTETLEEIEKQIIVDRLKRCHGNRKKTAKELGIAKSTLHEKLKKWKDEEGPQDWPLARWGGSPQPLALT